jgi:hypothetical protein
LRFTRRAVLGAGAALTLVAWAAAAVIRGGQTEQPYPQRVHTVTALPADAQPGTAHSFYAPDGEPSLEGQPSSATFGVTGAVVTPDGTVWLQQALRFTENDNQALTQDSDLGLALVRIEPDGDAELVDSPFADRRRGRDLRPLCAGADGSVWATPYEGAALVRRDESGKWVEVVAGGPSHPLPTACAAEPGGSVLVAAGCLAQRVWPDGRLTVVAGRPELGRAPGCGSTLRGRRGDAPPGTFGADALRTALPHVEDVAISVDGAVWLNASDDLVRLTHDGRLVQERFPGETADTAVSEIATAGDGSLYLAAHDRTGPVRLLRRAPNGRWTSVTELRARGGTPRLPAPAGEANLGSARFAVGPNGWLYFFGARGVVALRT